MRLPLLGYSCPTPQKGKNRSPSERIDHLADTAASLVHYGTHVLRRLCSPRCTRALRASASARKLKGVALRHPIMPVADSFGGW
jgi:hypothetical protein